MMRIPAVLLSASLLAATAAAGTITGSVPVSGTADADRTVVYVQNVPDAAAVGAKRARLSQKGSRFTPTVLPVVKGTTVDLTNDDWVAHSTFSKSEAAPFDLGLYAPGSVRSVSFERLGAVEVFCAIHPRMNAMVLVLQNSFFAKPDAQGQFSIADVPAGTYSLRVFRLNGEIPPKSVNVPATGSVSVTF